MESSILANFDAAVASCRRRRLSRLWRSPIHLLRSKFLEVYAKRFHTPVWRRTRTFWGDEMQIVFPERVSMSIYRYHFFERGLTQIVLNKVKPGMTFFDVGAHFGYYSLLASHLVGERGSVHSFEPTPSTFEVLKRNTARKSNIHINNAALWSTPSTVKLRDYGVTFSAFNSVGDGAVQDYMAEDVESTPCEVRATTIDEYVATTGVAPDFVKLDAEGAEFHIVQGMTETFKRTRPIITVELGEGPQDQGTRSRAVVEALLAKGYEAFEAQNGKITPYSSSTRSSYRNVLLVPR